MFGIIVSWEDYAYSLYLLFSHHGTLYTTASFPQTSAEASSHLLSPPPTTSSTQHEEVYTPSNPYFAAHTLVGIGHSMAAIAFLLTMTYPSTSTFPTFPPPPSTTTSPPAIPPRLPYASLILIDPMLVPRQFEARMGRGLENGSSARRDTWGSREEAFEAFFGRKKGGWARWDRRVLWEFCVSCLDSGFWSLVSSLVCLFFMCGFG